MHNIAASTIYPPLAVAPWWLIAGVGVFVAVVCGYWLVHLLRIRLALRAQRRIAQLQKPHKASLINRALAEIARIRAEVEAGRLAPDVGAQQVSLTARGVFDTLMNHRTSYAAKYEVAQRSLTTLLQMMDDAYPKEFANQRDSAANFGQLCELAVKVVQSCN